MVYKSLVASFKKKSIILSAVIALLASTHSSVIQPIMAQSASKKCSGSSDCLADGWESCVDKNGELVTEKNSSITGYCVHKDILPLKGEEFWGLIFIFWFMWYANMGGVGGGGIVVPISILFFKFDPKNAIALSNFSIFLSSLIRYLMFANTPHPLKKGKGLIISYNLAIIMLPMIISGVSVGVIFNTIVSDLIICIFYVILISLIGVATLRKALKLYTQEMALKQVFKNKIDLLVQAKKDDPQSLNNLLQVNNVDQNRQIPTETHPKIIKDDEEASNKQSKDIIELKEINYKIADFEQDDLEEESAIQQVYVTPQPLQIIEQPSEEYLVKIYKENDDKSNFEGGSAEETVTKSTEQDDKLERLNKMHEYESTNFQWVKLALQLGIIMVLVLISLLRGSGSDSLIDAKRCDHHDWTLFICLQVICFIFLFFGIKVVKNEFEEKRQCGYEFSPGDLEATPKNLLFLCAVSFVGSMAAGFSGIGPGFIFCPVLMMLGVEARVATSTGMYITMLTTLACSIQTIFFKKINLQYSLYIQIMTVMGTFPGIFFQGYIVQKYARVSYQVFLMTGMIFIAMVSVTALNVPATVHKQEQGIAVFELFDYCQQSSQ